MFLLNLILEIACLMRFLSLQYKMFLLNAQLSWNTVGNVSALQYKMFLLNSFKNKEKIRED